jgi:capsular polysaccharide biosynthesis protein
MSQIPQKDFDLIDVAAGAYRLAKRHYRPLILLPIAGALLALLLSLVLINPVYQNSFIVYVRVLSSAETLQLIKDLGTLKEANDSKKLAQVLEISEEQARSLKSITARRVEDKNNQIDSTSTVIVEFETSKPKDYETIQNALVKYISEMPYVKKENALFLQQQEELYQTIQNQLRRLDSMHTTLISTINNITKDKQVIINSIYTEIVSLKKEQLRIKKELQYPEAVRIIEPVRPISKPAKASPQKNTLVGFFAGLFLAVLYIFFAEMKKRAEQTAV